MSAEDIVPHPVMLSKEKLRCLVVTPGPVTSRNPMNSEEYQKPCLGKESEVNLKSSELVWRTDRMEVPFCLRQHGTANPERTSDQGVCADQCT